MRAEAPTDHKMVMPTTALVTAFLLMRNAVVIIMVNSFVDAL